MANLLLVIFIIKILAQPGLFKYIKEKYGHNVMQQCRSYERLCTRKQKLVCDLEFLLKCKREGLIPIFARPKLSIDVPHKTQEKISKLILESEINNKHKIKNELNKNLQNMLSATLPFNRDAAKIIQRNHIVFDEKWVNIRNVEMWKDLIRKMLKVSAEERITVEGAIKELAAIETEDVVLGQKRAMESSGECGEKRVCGN